MILLFLATQYSDSDKLLAALGLALFIVAVVIFLYWLIQMFTNDDF